MALQVLIICIGKSPLHIVNDGLSGTQWGICIGFSAITFVVSFLVKLLPIHLVIDKYIAPKNEEKEEDENSDNKEIKDKKEEENLSNGAEKKILQKEENWNSDRNLNEVVYKKEN